MLKNWCPPAIEFTFVPPYASFEDPQGRVRCVRPADYKVAVYIYVSGWWTKPYWAWLLMPIQPDGTWTCDITTEGTDQLATRIAAFLVPNGYDPPLMSGGQTLPAELFEHAVAHVLHFDARPRRVTMQQGKTYGVSVDHGRAGGCGDERRGG